MLHCDIDILEKAFQMVMLLWKERRGRSSSLARRSLQQDLGHDGRKVTCEAKLDRLLHLLGIIDV